MTFVKVVSHMRFWGRIRLVQPLDNNDMLFHMLAVGGTGNRRTNAILYMLDLLFEKKGEDQARPNLFPFDPAGDTSGDLLRALPSPEWGRVVIFDPQYVTAIAI